MKKSDLQKMANETVTRCINALPEPYRKNLPEGWRRLLKEELLEDLECVNNSK